MGVAAHADESEAVVEAGPRGGGVAAERAQRDAPRCRGGPDPRDRPRERGLVAPEARGAAEREVQIVGADEAEADAGHVEDLVDPLHRLARLDLHAHEDLGVGALQVLGPGDPQAQVRQEGPRAALALGREAGPAHRLAHLVRPVHHGHHDALRAGVERVLDGGHGARRDARERRHPAAADVGDAPEDRGRRPRVDRRVLEVDEEPVAEPLRRQEPRRGRAPELEPRAQRGLAAAEEGERAVRAHALTPPAAPRGARPASTPRPPGAPSTAARATRAPARAPPAPPAAAPPRRRSDASTPERGGDRG